MKPKTEILIKYSDLVGKYPLKKIFEYLNILQKTGITNMWGATPYLYGGREWIQKQIDYFDIGLEVRKKHIKENLKNFHLNNDDFFINYFKKCIYEKEN